MMMICEHAKSGDIKRGKNEEGTEMDARVAAVNPRVPYRPAATT